MIANSCNGRNVMEVIDKQLRSGVEVRFSNVSSLEGGSRTGILPLAAAFLLQEAGDETRHATW